MGQRHLLLHNIRSVYNVGAIFRSADAFGVDKIWLTGYTPTPQDRYGRVRGDMAKTALGAEQSVAWQSVSRTRPVVERLQRENFSVVAVEQSENSVSLSNWRPPEGNLCLVFGSEPRGLSPRLLSQMDQVVEIPMLGEKESLNVSVAAGIVLFQLINKS